MTNFKQIREAAYKRYSRKMPASFSRVRTPLVPDLLTLVYEYYKPTEVEHFEMVVMTGHVYGQHPPTGIGMVFDPYTEAKMNADSYYDADHLQDPGEMMEAFDGDALRECIYWAIRDQLSPIHNGLFDMIYVDEICDTIANCWYKTYQKSASWLLYQMRI